MLLRRSRDRSANHHINYMSTIWEPPTVETLRDAIANCGLTDAELRYLKATASMPRGTAARAAIVAGAHPDDAPDDKSIGEYLRSCWNFYNGKAVKKIAQHLGWEKPSGKDTGWVNYQVTWEHPLISITDPLFSENNGPQRTYVIRPEWYVALS